MVVYEVLNVSLPDLQSEASCHQGLVENLVTICVNSSGGFENCWEICRGSCERLHLERFYCSHSLQVGAIRALR